jgi:hypothetical protein
LGTEGAATVTADPPADSPFKWSAIPFSIPWRAPHVRRRRQLETHWYQCLAYPFLNWGLLSSLAVGLATGSFFLTLMIPELPRFSELSRREWLPYAVLLLGSLLALSFTYITVECALLTALAGEGPGLYWPSRSFLAMLKSSSRWLICFFAGPIVPLVFAGCFWLYGGDLTTLDRAIVAELIVLALGYWFLAVVCSAQSNRLRDANPARIAQLLCHLRYRSIAPVLVAPVLACVHGYAAFLVLAGRHQPIFVWLLLIGCWTSGLFSITFMFRLLGVWCHRAKRSLVVRSFTVPARVRGAATS